MTDPIPTNDTLSDTLKAVKLTVDAVKDTVCLNRNAVIALAPGAGFTTGALQWERSTNNGGLWSPIANSDITNYATPNLTGNTWFRVKMTSAPNTCYSDTAKIYTTDPQLLTSTPDTSRCGPGTMTLVGTTTANSVVKWFDAPNSATPVATGNTFVTPYLGQTDTFYVSAGVPNAQPGDAMNITSTSGYTISTGYYMPFYGYNTSSKVEYIYTAQELTAQGFSAGFINSVGISAGSLGMPNVGSANISMKLTNATTPITTFQTTGMTTVYSNPSLTLTPNAINTFNFQVPFYWDGVSNIYISFCNTGGQGSGSNTINGYYNSANYRSVYGYSSTINMCTTTNVQSTMYYVPSLYVKMTSACETNKKAIRVVVNPLPAVDLGPDVNKCVDQDQAEVLDAGVQPYTPQFLWDNGTTSQVRAVTETGVYNVKVTNQFGCHNSDTVNVILRDNPIVKLGNDTTVCNGVVLTLNPGNSGIEYFWNTGQTSQSINVSSAGVYNVFVTNSVGCTKADTIVINMEGELPTIQGINVTNNGQFTFHFTAINPDKIIDLDKLDDRFKGNKIESVCVVVPQAGKQVLILVADDDKG
ncbi:MAG: hypothetical protein EOP49_27100, partial [Sphingobacteriales bacterium]